jgi:tetratricopeptide (TPR) repeat protein
LAHTATRAWDKAAEDLTAATGRNNDNPDAHLQLARVYFEMDELIASLREYTIAIQQRPGFAAAYQGRSVVKLALGDSAGSHEDLGKIAR